MIRYASILAVVSGILTTSYVESVTAQNYDRVQPIVLTLSPASCQSPARITQPPVVRHAVESSYISPSVSESMPSAISASEMVPLPAGPPRRGYSAKLTAPAVQYTVPAPAVTPDPSVQAFRPVTSPTVPDGYTVGRGLVGQPKFYKPGQPVLNLLRYLSL